MTRMVTRSSSLSVLFILLLASMLTFTACDSSSVVGPESDTPEDTIVLNEQVINDDPPSGGSTDPSDGHNTGCPAGDPEC